MAASAKGTICAGSIGSAGLLSGDHRRLLAETAMFRCKPLMVGRVSLHNYNGLVGEVMAYVSTLKKLNPLGLPVRKPQGQLPLGALKVAA